MNTEHQISLEVVIQSLLEDKKYTTLKDMLSTMNAADIAAVFDELPEGKLPVLFRLLPKELAADAFVEMHTDLQQLLIHGFSDAELRAVVSEMFVDDTADLVEEMPANVVSRILQQVDPEKRKTINEILKYPEDSAGSIMTTEYVSLRPGMTAGEAVARIRQVGVNKASIDTCFVVDQTRHLTGTVTLRELILAEENAEISQLAEPTVISVQTAEDQETVASMFAKYDLSTIPVVDGENRLVGIVTIDDAVDVLVEEATEDMEKMAAITPSDKPYLKTTVLQLWKSRIPWLMFLMLSATVTGIIINKFENALTAQVALAAFIPMLMGTGGNCGSQSSVTVIRALSLGEIEFSDLPRILWKEIRTAVLCGLALAVVCFLKIWLIDRLLMGNTDITILVNAVVCLAMFATVLASKIIGAIMPVAAVALKLDPAVMASPFITSIVDTLSLLVYFLFATAILRI